MVRSGGAAAAGLPTLVRIRNWLMPSGRLVGPPIARMARSSKRRSGRDI